MSLAEVNGSPRGIRGKEGKGHMRHCIKKIVERGGILGPTYSGEEGAERMGE